MTSVAYRAPNKNHKITSNGNGSPIIHNMAQNILLPAVMVFSP
jgi:hypothetical protein